MPKPLKGQRKWHALLLPHPEVATWYENMARRNRVTADESLRRLARTVDEALAKTPMDLLKMPQPELEDAATLCVTKMFDRKLAGSTVNGFYVTLTSFLAWHGRKLERQITIPGADEYASAEDEAIPDQDSLRATLAAAELRTRVIILVMANGGQRPEVLGKGAEGLRLQDFVEMTLGQDDVTFTKIPTRVEVGKALSKNGMRYFFFLGPEACHAIRAYLRSRILNGEVLMPESPLVRPYGGPSRFSLRGNLSDAARRAMERAKIKARPYVWRSFYAHHCQLAEPDGFLEAWRKFFMGHKGDIQTRYANRKLALPAASIEQMRSAYNKALRYIEPAGATRINRAEVISRAILGAAGATGEEEELAIGKSAEEIARRVERCLERELRPVVELKKLKQTAGDLYPRGHPVAITLAKESDLISREEAKWKLPMLLRMALALEGSAPGPE